MTVMDKIRQAFEQAKQDVLEGKELHVGFTQNSKTHMYSIGLLPLLTCHGRCRKTCGEIKEGKQLPPCYACNSLIVFRIA